jgi:hypothetical protein
MHRVGESAENAATSAGHAVERTYHGAATAPKGRQSGHHPGAQDVDKVALYLIGERKSQDFYDGLLNGILVGFQFHVTVLPNRVSCPRIASLGLSEAAGIDHRPLVEPPRELQMGVARENNIRSRAGLLVAFSQRRIRQSVLVEEVRWRRVAKE